MNLKHNKYNKTVNKTIHFIIINNYQFSITFYTKNKILSLFIKVIKNKNH